MDECQVLPLERCEGFHLGTDSDTCFGPPNVLSLSRARPYRARLATRKRRAKRGAEAPGQRTAARRLLRRVGPPVQLPFVQNRANRTIKDDYFRSRVVATLHETQSGPPLRAQSDVSL